MRRFKHVSTLYLPIFAAIVCFGAVGCGNDSPTSVGGIGPQPETFPGLLQEEWFFFWQDQVVAYPDTSFHHFEVFTYEYDENGRRVHGKFFHGESGIRLVLSYTYDSEERLIGEHWESPDIPDIIFWDLTYEYDESKTRIVGGEGKGTYDWRFVYEYDREGRRIRTKFIPITGGPEFTLHHQYDDQGQCVLATGTEQRGLSIVVVYTYAQTDADLRLVLLKKVMGEQGSMSACKSQIIDRLAFFGRDVQSLAE